MRPVLLGVLLVAGCRADDGLLVFVAASAGPAMEEAVAQWSAASGTPVRASMAASSVLVHQVQSGAEPDLVLLASTDWADRLQAAGYGAERVDLLTNGLEVIGAPGTVPPDPASESFGLDFQGCLALGDPDHVPVGQYARAALESLGQWEAVEGRVVPTLDAPAAVALVARGECPVGIAYSTDAVRLSVVRGDAIPAAAHPAVRYPLLLPRAASPEASALYEWLQGPGARAVFDRYGFGTPEAGAP